jgi:putative restriction endonuclease
LPTPHYDAFVQDLDTSVRTAAFGWLKTQTRLLGDVLPRSILETGFDHVGERIPLVGPQGIFKPRLCRLPLSITTSPNSPYEDRFGYAGEILYKYRGQNPDHHENVGLRVAMAEQVPVIYFHGLVPGRYLAAWPVYIASDDPSSRTFTARADEPEPGTSGGYILGEEARRMYATRTVLQRIHQRAFRERVIAAYRTACAICHLRHQELLDAAHILPDAHPQGQPVIANGLALCKLHHAAFDWNLVGIRPDLVVEVRADVLDETDGPMLRYGLQAVHGGVLSVPRRPDYRPSRERLEERYQEFREAS